MGDIGSGTVFDFGSVGVLVSELLSGGEDPVVELVETADGVSDGNVTE